MVCVQQVRFASPRVSGADDGLSPRPRPPGDEQVRFASPRVTGADDGQSPRPPPPRDEQVGVEKVAVHSDAPGYDPELLAETGKLERAPTLEPSRPAAVERSGEEGTISPLPRPSSDSADISLVGAGKVRVSLIHVRQGSNESLSPGSSQSPVDGRSPKIDQPANLSSRNSPREAQASPNGDDSRISLDQNSPNANPRTDQPRAGADLPSPRNIPRDSGKLRVSLVDARGMSKEPSITPTAKTGPGDKVAVSLLEARAARPNAVSPVPGPSSDGKSAGAAPAGKVAVSLLGARSGAPKPANAATPTAKPQQESKAPAPGEKVAFSLLGARGGPKAKPKAAVQQESKSPAEIQPEAEPQVRPEKKVFEPPALAVPLVKPPAREDGPPHSGRSNATSSTAPGTPGLPTDAPAEDAEAGDDGVLKSWQWRNNALDLARQMTPAQQLSSLSTKEMEQFTTDLKRMMKTYDQANPQASVRERRLNESRYTTILREKYVYKRG